MVKSVRFDCPVDDANLASGNDGKAVLTNQPSISSQGDLRS